MRGPVHEAFAEPISFDPEPGPLAPAAPPPPIDEFPPEYRPAGYNVQWIPGYWAWDDDYNDFIWISGIWRDVPPGREWIAGYWIRSDGGFRWIPGFWSSANANQTLYLPEPPASVETGIMHATAPSPNHIWVGGTWVWQGNGYAWRPGHWVLGQPDWIWVPAHYVWTPRGYIFVDGYWDYDIENRGVLFAPARFEASIYRRPNFRYSPSIVIDIARLTDHLFLRPKHYHYYFGDYYDERYVNRGFRPWFTAFTSRKVYDPIYAHRRWRNRNNSNWDAGLRRDFDERRRNQNARPPRTWSDQRHARGRDGDSRGDQRGGIGGLIGRALNEIVNGNDRGRQFNRVDDNQRRELSQRRSAMDRIREAREKIEGRTDGKPDQRYRTRTVPAHGPGYKSPITSKPKDQQAEVRKPPAEPKPPSVKTDVKPSRRVVKERPAQARKQEDSARDRDRDKDRDRDARRRDDDRERRRVRDRNKDD